MPLQGDTPLREVALPVAGQAGQPPNETVDGAHAALKSRNNEGAARAFSLPRYLPAR